MKLTVKYKQEEDGRWLAEREERGGDPVGDAAVVFIPGSKTKVP